MLYQLTKLTAFCAYAVRLSQTWKWFSGVLDGWEEVVEVFVTVHSDKPTTICSSSADNAALVYIS